MKSISSSYCAHLLILSALFCSGGCTQRAASKLLGRWEGRPDSAETRAARDAQKYGDEIAGSSSADVTPADATPTAEGTVEDAIAELDQTTDWEEFDVTIVMDFVSSDRVEMTLGGEQPVVGTWKVLSTTPSGCTIEVATEGASTKDGAKQSVRRRFELLLDEREGTLVGFQLSEAGADAQLGALYFQRPGAMTQSGKN